MLEPDAQQPIQTASPNLGQVYNPFVEPQLSNPYPFYAQARREEPVFFSELLQSWMITRYHDVRSILLQPDIFSSKDTLQPVVEWIPEVIQMLAKDSALFVPIIINTDGKEHQRFRAPLNKAFHPARLKAMEDTVRTVANRLIDAFYEQGQTDLMTTFAGPLPQEIMLRLFGIPPADIARCKQWSDDYLHLIYTRLSPEDQLKYARSVVAFNAYMGDLVEEESKHPGEGIVGSLLTIHEDAERPLNRMEIVGMLSGMLMAGHETTTNLLGTAIRILLSQPERWQHICAHPDDIPSTVEEVLRFDASTQAFFRTALQEVQIGGVTIPEGARLLLVYGSANRDEARFDHADQFDIHRSSNQHFGFGHGVHFCAGAPLARLQGRVALELLSQRLPNLRLPPQQLSYFPNALGHLLTHMLVEWDVAPEAA